MNGTSSPKDYLSVNKWYQQEKKSYFFYQRPEGEDVPFITGIQTEWMFDMMVKCSHNNMLALDSTFSTNKCGVSFISSFNVYTEFNVSFNIINTVKLRS